MNMLSGYDGYKGHTKLWGKIDEYITWLSRICWAY
jgi:hypothetical protein